MKLTHINPESLHKNPAFSQAIKVTNSTAMLYIGGQNGITATGELVSEDIASQTEQALSNVLEILKSADASQEQVVKLTIYIVQGQNVRSAFAASQKIWGMHPTTISVIMVAGLAVPGALVEVDAICAVEE